MTSPTPAEKLVEEVARAICKARGIDPDTCVHGSGGTGQPIVCHLRAWQQHIGQARAAIAVVVEACVKLATDVADGSRELHNAAAKDRDRDGVLLHGEIWRVATSLAAAIRSLSKDQEHE
jgi:isopentenyl phosphate kinase